MLEYTPQNMGGTMRLGSKNTIFNDKYSSVLRKLYGSPKSVNERHRHRYEINAEYVDRLEAEGMHFVGTDSENERMEIMELADHPYYVGVQFHPEYLSRPLQPSPPFLGLILASKNKLKSYLSGGCKLSPRELSDNSSGLDFHFHSKELSDFFLFIDEGDLMPLKLLNGHTKMNGSLGSRNTSNSSIDDLEK